MSAAIRSLALIVLGLALAACGSSVKETERAAREGILLLGNGSEPKGLDPHLQTGVTENHIISALIEGLIAYHPTDDLQPEPGIAESWESADNFTTWTFHLRENAKWTNGDPVVADDFVYSWQRMLTPELGAEYAPMLYVIKNGEAYHTGRIKDFSQVGVKALDAHTLVVTLEGPTPYFLLMLKHYSFYPVNPRAVEAHGGMTNRQSGWSTLENYVGNGPFRMTQWVTNQIIVAEKNPGYWDANRVKLKAIHFFPVDNANSEETLFRGGRLHKTNTVPSLKIPFFRERLPGEMHTDPYLGTYFYRLNVTRKPFDDVRVRKALALAIDRELLVTRVLRGGQAAATGYTPQGMVGYDTLKVLRYDPKEARRLLAEAGYPGGKGFPAREILINTSEDHRRIAEAIQAMWQKNLGIRMGIYNQEWKVYLESQSNLDYDVSRSAWIADYVYPTTFLDMFTTGNGNNDTGWSNREFDRLILKSRVAQTEDERLETLRMAEEILLEEMPIIPFYWYTSNYLLDQRVKGWHPTLLDNHPYKYVSLDPGAASK